MGNKALAAKLADTRVLARLIADPKGTAKELGIMETDTAAIRDLERLALTGGRVLAAVGASAGLKSVAADDWGIGASCCNKKPLAFTTFRDDKPL